MTDLARDLDRVAPATGAESAAVALPAVPEGAFPWPAVEHDLRRKADWSQRYRGGLLVVDALMISLAAIASYLLTGFDFDDALNGLQYVSYDALLPVMVLLWLVALEAADSRQPSILGAGPEEYRRLLKGTAMVFGTLAVASYLLDLSVSRRLFLVLLPVGALTLLVGRWASRSFLTNHRSRGLALMPTLVVGAADRVPEVVRELRKATAAGYRPDGVCLIGEPSGSEEDLLELEGLQRHQVEHLHEIARRGRYEAVIIAEGLDRSQIKQLAWHLENQGTSLLMVPRLADVAGPRLSIRDAQGLALVHVDLPKYTGWKPVAKRAFDIVFSGVALLLISPILAAVAIAIKLDDRGPILFRQERVGLRGETFTIHKFRTMCVDAEAKIDALIAAKGGKALLFKLEDDPRITRIGKILRKYSLDELPQFWTVLRGGMSVVGPRPQVAREVAEYTDAHHRRLLIKPGITGLWQVSGRSELSLEESIRLDLKYVENWSPLDDLIIVLKTVRIVLRPAGAF